MCISKAVVACSIKVWSRSCIADMPQIVPAVRQDDSDQRVVCWWQISTKKELSHTISPRESSNNDRSVPRKRSGESQNYSKKKKKTTSKKAARERRGGWEYNSNIVFLLKDVL